MLTDCAAVGVTITHEVDWLSHQTSHPALEAPMRDGSSMIASNDYLLA